MCEGSVTEVNYFRGFPFDERKFNVIVRGLGRNTDSLVREAVRLRAELAPVAETWVVFDRDSFQAIKFNEAIHLAAREGLNVAYTNEAFEAWYLMHYDYCDADLSRETYEDRLTAALGRRYRKNDPRMYDTLEAHQATAIENAERLLASYGAAHDPEADNPSTTVHRLVKRLNELR